MSKKQEEYTVSITEAIQSLFDAESEISRYDYGSLDATKFFTAYVMAGCLIYNHMTGDDKNSLEFTHLANQLVVQHMLEVK